MFSTHEMLTSVETFRYLKSTKRFHISVFVSVVLFIWDRGSSTTVTIIACLVLLVIVMNMSINICFFTNLCWSNLNVLSDAWPI